MPGKKMRSIKGGAKGRRMYEHIRASGASKAIAAATVNKWAGRRKRKK